MLALISGTLVSGTLISCVPGSKTLNDPEVLNSLEPSSDLVLRAFMETVIPGLPAGDPGLTVIFYDEYYRFAPYRKRFVRDLRKRAAYLFGSRQYEALSLEQRTAVVEDGLERPGISRSLYSAAIYLTQIAGYTAFYKESGECALIDFKTKFDPEVTSYANYDKYLARNLTRDGNFR